MPRYEATFEFIRSSVVEQELVSLAREEVLDQGCAGVLKLSGRRVVVSLDAPNKEEAFEWALTVVERFRRWTILKVGCFVPRPAFLGLSSDRPGGSILPSLLLSWNAIAKSPEEIRQDAEEAAAACSVNDPALDKAAAYFEHGVYATLESSGPDPDLMTMAFDAIDGVLNFHKALELLLGEDPQDAVLRALEPDRQRRRILRQRLEPIYKLRHHFDVAHPRLDWTALNDVRERAGLCREATRDVLLLYLSARARGDSVPRPV